MDVSDLTASRSVPWMVAGGHELGCLDNPKVTGLLYTHDSQIAFKKHKGKHHE